MVFVPRAAELDETWSYLRDSGFRTGRPAKAPNLSCAGLPSFSGPFPARRQRLEVAYALSFASSLGSSTTIPSANCTCGHVGARASVPPSATFAQEESR